MVKNLKKKCCGKFRKKGKFCSRCPVKARMQGNTVADKKVTRKTIEKKKKKLAKQKKKLDKKLGKKSAKKFDKKAVKKIK